MYVKSSTLYNHDNGKIYIFFFTPSQLDYNQDAADWSRGNILTTPVDIKDWIIIFYNRNIGETNDLIHALCRVGPAMGMNYRQPQR